MEKILLAAVLVLFLAGCLGKPINEGYGDAFQALTFDDGYRAGLSIGANECLEISSGANLPENTFMACIERNEKAKQYDVAHSSGYSFGVKYACESLGGTYYEFIAGAKDV